MAGVVQQDVVECHGGAVLFVETADEDFASTADLYVFEQQVGVVGQAINARAGTRVGDVDEYGTLAVADADVAVRDAVDYAAL